MSVKRAWNRRIIEVGLLICAAIIWTFDWRMIVANVGIPALDIQFELESPITSTTIYPWKSANLPWIPWNPFPPTPDPLPTTETEQSEKPDLKLQGLMINGDKRAALVREVESGQTRLMLEGETWNGFELKEIGSTWIELVNGSSKWKISLPSTTLPDR